MSRAASKAKKRVYRITTIGLLLCTALVPFVAKADWLNLTGAETAPNIAEIYVLDDRVRLVLEVYVGDLHLFPDLVPNELLRNASADRPSLEERMRRFSQEQIQFVTETGEKLRGRLVLAEPRLRVDRQSPFAGMINPTTRQRVPEAPADTRVLYVEIDYPYTTRPNQLTFVPPVDDEGRTSATIGFIAYHKAVPIIDFRYLGTPALLSLDWDDPWYTKFANPNLKRHHKSALMSFLYVEPYEVRHEVLTRVKDLEEWMDLGLRGHEYIEIDELEVLQQRVGEFFLARNSVRIDEQLGTPILDRTNYVKVGLKGIQLIEQPERLEISTAIIGVIVTYLTDGIPSEVTVDWELFTDQIQQVPATATDPAGPLATFLSPDDNVHTWTNFLKNYKLPTVREVSTASSLGEIEIPLATLLCFFVLLPVGWQVSRHLKNGTAPHRPIIIVATLLLVGALTLPYARIAITRPVAFASELDDQQATTLLESLLKNVYRAFDFRQEEDVYDRLAISVTGELLADVYLENRRSFAVQAAGGAQAKVKEIRIQNASAERVDGALLSYALRGQWTAMGTVGHWGHVHTRQNLYDAIVTIEAIDGTWKITGLEVIEENRIDPSATPVTPNAASPAQG
ncbi:MAG: hypothetical protein ACR2QI_05200 [Woeseiaceae bacterium]